MSDTLSTENPRAERQVNRRVNLLLAVMMAAFVGGAGWYFGDPSSHHDGRDDGKEKHEHGSTGQTTLKTNRDSTHRQWQQRIKALRNGLPPSRSDTAKTLEGRLDGAIRQLTTLGEELPTDSAGAANIEKRLTSIEQQAVLLRTIALSRSVDVDLTRVEESAAALLKDEETQTNDAIRQATESVRSKLEPGIRAARLTLGDIQDEIAGLRERIAKTQREQTQNREREERAEALARDMADVRKYLTAFTSPGHLQPDSEKNAWTTIRTVDAIPVSFSSLQKAGALEDTMKGLERLYIFGGGRNPALHNRRPLGEFPQYWANHINKPEVLAILKRAQQLLRDHGQALVEAKLLTP